MTTQEELIRGFGREIGRVVKYWRPAPQPCIYCGCRVYDIVNHQKECRERHIDMRKLWDGSSTITIPAAVATCPECGGEIYVDIFEICSEDGEQNWHVDENGSGLHIQCVKEDDSHYQMPYVDWLPLEKPVIDWLNASYEFQPQAS